MLKVKVDAQNGSTSLATHSKGTLQTVMDRWRSSSVIDVMSCDDRKKKTTLI